VRIASRDQKRDIKDGLFSMLWLPEETGEEAAQEGRQQQGNNNHNNRAITCRLGCASCQNTIW